MSRNAFSKIDHEYTERQDMLDHARMERKQSTCQHEEGTRFQAYDSDGCGFYIWKCDACGWECVDDMP